MVDIVRAVITQQVSLVLDVMLMLLVLGGLRFPHQMDKLDWNLNSTGTSILVLISTRRNSCSNLIKAPQLF